jgi:hypothetical protein
MSHPRRNASPKEKTQAFVIKGQKLHGNKYDYSRVRYKSSDDPVEVICRKHGSFFPIPYNHLGARKTGCRKCAGEKHGKCKRESFGEIFISRAQALHGQKYNYSKARYFKVDESVLIICSQHGEFQITPHEHLGGAGCQKCGIANRNKKRSEKTATTFIARSRKIHGRIYDYKKTVYRDSREHVLVGCKKSGHGLFSITPNNHLNGWGCPKCKAQKAGNAHRYTKTEFVRLARKVHGVKYTYPEKYIDGRISMQIRCLKHGMFKQAPNSHLTGRGCPICGRERTSKALFDTHEDFIRKARSAHGDKYSYPEKYERVSRLLTIVCKKHGSFKQKPDSHTAGHGCERCSESWGERQVAKALELLGLEFEVEKRFKECRDKKRLRKDVSVKVVKGEESRWGSC